MQGHKLLARTPLVFLVGCASAATPTATTSPTPVSPTPVACPAEAKPPIERALIEQAQKAWCAALIDIGRASTDDRDEKELAEKVLSAAYDYDTGVVLFKPTLTHGAQTFRLDKQGALAYFVGGDAAYPDDKGFARKAFTSCEPTIAGFVASGDMAIAMGNVVMVDAKGAQVKVDKTFGYRRDDSGNLKIVLHHSSLPYTPTAKGK